MSQDSPILPEDLFRKGFQDFEAPENPQAWEHMRALLDKEQDTKPVAIIPDKKKTNNNRTLTILLLIMTTASIISLVTWMSLGYQANNNAATHTGSNHIVSAPVNNADTHQLTSSDDAGNNHTRTTPVVPSEPSVKTVTKGLASLSKPAIRNIETRGILPENNSISMAPPQDTTKTKKAGAVKTVKAVQTIAMQTQVLQQTISQTNTLLNNAKSAVKPLVSLLDTPKTGTPNGKYKNVVVRKEWVPDQYDYVDLPKKGAIDDFWIGMQFTTQKLLSNDTINKGRQPAGFNIQFMSGNLLKKTDVIGAYAGFDWGMQFYGRSNNSNVVINTVKQDSGYTRLNMSSMDFLMRGHLEYAKFPLIPYVNAFAGPRLYMTNQKVASYLKLSDNASSSSNNAHTSASMMVGLGVGARLRITPTVSLDARYEMTWGTNVKIVDLDQSKFTGLSYQLNLKEISPNYQQIKFGVIFDLSENKQEKKLVTPGHYVESVYDSVYVDPKDSNVRYLPCPCVPCAKQSQQIQEDDQNNTPNNNNNSSGNKPRRRSSIYIPSGTGGGSRGSFPGVRPPVIINR